MRTVICRTRYIRCVRFFDALDMRIVINSKGTFGIFMGQFFVWDPYDLGGLHLIECINRFTGAGESVS